jgi:hypothetical protein
MCSGAGLEFEDWTASLRNLCKACSEGRPHEGHDQELRERRPWSLKRRIGFAAMERESLDTVLRDWAAEPRRKVLEIQCTLNAIQE